ncbi:recombinase RecT [Mesobacterium pallidum]|uniref:recombinase RecT n=1 Tax=Mesobacterium pallidum TaxID=2872037 RepID=UPI001EE30319|nr:recombinase RecT [Mesobacterium pallidum]
MSNLQTMQPGAAALSQPQQMQSPLGMFDPSMLESALKAADLLANSSLVPKDYQRNPGNCLIAIQWGAEVGLPPLQAMQNIAVINGRPSLWGDAVIALVRASGLLEYMNEDIYAEGPQEEWRATCTVKRKGQDALVREFTWQDAKTAGLAGKQGPWQQYPKRMLQMRARGFALRDGFPDVLKGMHVAEEAQDMPVEPRDITPPDDEVTEREPTKPLNKSAALRDKVKTTRKKDEAPAVTLETVEAAIWAATDGAELKEAAKDAEKLSPEDQKKARAAYAEARDALRNLSNPHNHTYSIIAEAIVTGKDIKAAMRDHAEALDRMKVEDARLHERLMSEVDEALAEAKGQGQMDA